MRSLPEPEPRSRISDQESLGAGSPTNQKDSIMKNFKDFPGISKNAAYWKKMNISLFLRGLTFSGSGFWFCWFAGEAGFC